MTVISTPDDAGLTSDFTSVDVSPDLTIGEFKAVVQADLNAPTASQILQREDQVLSDDSQTLAQAGVKENDVLALTIRPRQQPQQRQQQRQPQNNQSQIASEDFRQRMLREPQFMQAIQQRDQELSGAVNDPQRFQQIFEARTSALQEQQRRLAAEEQRLEADMWDPAAQAEIAKRIRAQQIAKNIELAMEENPESFARVSMLYIDVVVNNVPIKAFVDSGAQTTIMSPDAAERCNITHLIDERYGGIARGVGTAKILGRVHHAYMQFGLYEAASSFTVMEGKDVDLLLGLDMLKRHQMCIDLKDNCLRVQDAKIEFLPEHLLPKMMEEALENEPKVEGPGGTTIGAETGTVEVANKNQGTGQSSTQASTSAQAASQSSSAAAAARPQQNTSQPAPAPTQGQLGFGQNQQVTEDSIRAVMNFGVSREEAIRLLEQAGGNPDLAVGLLF